MINDQPNASQCCFFYLLSVLFYFLLKDSDNVFIRVHLNLNVEKCGMNMCRITLYYNETTSSIGRIYIILFQPFLFVANTDL